MTDRDHADSARGAVDGLPPIFIEMKRHLLRELEAALEDHVRTRRARRGGAAAAVLAFSTIGLALLVSHRPKQAHPARQPAGPVDFGQPGANARRALLQRHSGPGPSAESPMPPTLASLETLPSRVSIAFDLIDDDDLVGELAALGIVARVMHVGERGVQLINADGSRLRSLAQASEPAPPLTPSS
ncbi:MAG: hypothetical protein SGJ11_06215 [Phycisphaerae bacterium]|nr:hypothetical protein [Phycisphaerae bacterium]